MLTLMIMMACGGSATEENNNEAASVSEWTGGEFDLQAVSANDTCLGGSFEALFMPEGPATPHTLEYAIAIPSYVDLPESYTIGLRAPFIEMPVTIDAPDGATYTIRGAEMEAVELGRHAYGDCVATMSVDIDLTPVTDNVAEGAATIHISNPRGEDDLCPIFQNAYCDVSLEINAIRR
jgi:hypothetical protein